MCSCVEKRIRQEDFTGEEESVLMYIRSSVMCEAEVVLNHHHIAHLYRLLCELYEIVARRNVIENLLQLMKYSANMNQFDDSSFICLPIVR